jgi:hypothetical protein
LNNWFKIELDSIECDETGNHLKYVEMKNMKIIECHSPLNFDDEVSRNHDSRFLEWLEKGRKEKYRKGKMPKIKMSKTNHVTNVL